jgi:hypothetical protein
MRRDAWLIAAAALLLSGEARCEVARQQEIDGYTRYELLAPGEHKFRIFYEVTAASPDATAFYNPIREGSVATDEHVFDRATGKPLHFTEVDGAVAAAGGVTGAKPGSRYIKVDLARPVPRGGGGGRIQINKTYEDAASYHEDAGTIVFERSLGIKRNTVVLPAEYILVACNYPSQIIQQTDGRIAVSFWNVTPAQAPLVLKARRAGLSRSASSVVVDERAHQSRNIVYYLDSPETHKFALTHDYTETRAGNATYVNIVRAGSSVSDPSGRDLDTGQPLATEVIQGDAVKRVEPNAKDVDASTVAVLFHYPPVKPGESRRLRLAETYTDPARYSLLGNELIWRRTLGRADNAVVLPSGWTVTNSSVPATVTRTADDRVRLNFLNPRDDELNVVLSARRILATSDR